MATSSSVSTAATAAPAASFAAAAVLRRCRRCPFTGEQAAAAREAQRRPAAGAAFCSTSCRRRRLRDVHRTTKPPSFTPLLPLSYSTSSTSPSGDKNEIKTRIDDDDDTTTKYRKTYRLVGEGTGSKVELKTGRHVLRTDVPKGMGGTDTAPQPVETLLAALAGCTQATAVFVGRRMKPNRVLVEKLEFELRAYRDERGALSLPIEDDPPVQAMLQRIEGTVRVHVRQQQTTRNRRSVVTNKGNKSDNFDVHVDSSSSSAGTISDEQLQILAHQTEIRCPVACMIKASGCVMEIEWIVAASSSSFTDDDDDKEK